MAGRIFFNLICVIALNRVKTHSVYVTGPPGCQTNEQCPLSWLNRQVVTRCW